MGIYPSRIPHDFGFIPHNFAYAVKQKVFLRLKLALLAFEVSFISNWFGAQIKFTWGSIKVYVRFTSDSNEAQFDFFYVHSIEAYVALRLCLA